MRSGSWRRLPTNPAWHRREARAATASSSTCTQRQQATTCAMHRTAGTRERLMHGRAPYAACMAVGRGARVREQTDSGGAVSAEPKKRIGSRQERASEAARVVLLFRSSAGHWWLPGSVKQLDDSGNASRCRRVLTSINRTLTSPLPSRPQRQTVTTAGSQTPQACHPLGATAATWTRPPGHGDTGVARPAGGGGSG